MPLEKLAHISFILALEFIMVCIICGVSGMPLGAEKRMVRHRRHRDVKQETPEKVGTSDLTVNYQKLYSSSHANHKETNLDILISTESPVLSMTEGVQNNPSPCSDCPAWFFDDESKKRDQNTLHVNLMILPLVVIFSFLVFILVKATHWCKEDILEADEKEVKVNMPPGDMLDEERSIGSEKLMLKCQEVVKEGSVKSASSVSWKDDVKQYKRSTSEAREPRRDRLAKVKWDKRSISIDSPVSSTRKGSDQKRTSRQDSKPRKANVINANPKSTKPSVRPLKLDRKGQIPTHKRGGKGARGVSKGHHYRTGSTRSNQSSTSSPNHSSSRLRLMCQNVPHSESLSPSTTCSSGYSSSVFRYDYQRAGSISSVESPSSRRTRRAPRGHIDPNDNLNTPDSYIYPSSEVIPFTPSEEAFLPPFKCVCDIGAASSTRRLYANSPGSITSLPVHLRSESTSGHSSIHPTPTGSMEKLGVAGGQHRALEKKDSSYGSLPDNSKAYQQEEESIGDQAAKVGRDHRLSSMDGTLLDMHNKQHEAMSLRKKLVRYLADNQKMTIELQDMFHTENINCPSPSSVEAVASSVSCELPRRKVKSWCTTDSKKKSDDQQKELLEDVRS